MYEAKLALVDLAGAERARETNNVGAQLRDGANINRSLLALANCINALGKRRKKGFVFVPFRNSKLTRLLKDGLCGNSRTAAAGNLRRCARTSVASSRCSSRENPSRSDWPTMYSPCL